MILWSLLCWWTAAEAATTVPPQLRHPSVPEYGCRANGRTYIDGEAVPSKDPCGKNCLHLSCLFIFLFLTKLILKRQGQKHPLSKFWKLLAWLTMITFIHLEHCYCMKHEVVCAVQECKVPCEGCVPIPSENDQCCPERYECREYTTLFIYSKKSLEVSPLLH